MAIQYIQPGKPNQNAYIERFNRTYPEEMLDQYQFTSLAHVREAKYWWMIDYSEERSHDSLGDMTPLEARQNQPEILFMDCLLEGEAYYYIVGLIIILPIMQKLMMIY